MSNQCCCDGYNTISNCVCCDYGSFSGMTVTSEITGFSNKYSCDVATHLNRTLVHSFDEPIGFPIYPHQCKDTLIAGNASYTPTHASDYCGMQCPPGGLHKGASGGSDCPVDIDIGVNSIPAAISNFSQNGILNGWECRCLDLCDYLKEYPLSATYYTGPYCWLVIWYTIHFRCNNSDKANSEVEYQVSFIVANADKGKYSSRHRDPCDTPMKICVPSGSFSPSYNLLNFGGIQPYDGTALCTDIDITIPLCPSFGTPGGDTPYNCNYTKPDLPDIGRNPYCFQYQSFCGLPVDFSSAQARLTLNMS